MVSAVVVWVLVRPHPTVDDGSLPADGLADDPPPRRRGAQPGRVERGRQVAGRRHQDHQLARPRSERLLRRTAHAEGSGPGLLDRPLLPGTDVAVADPEEA